MAVGPYPPVVGVLPALMDWVQSTFFLCQFPLFVQVGSSHQLDPQTETLALGQRQSF